MPFNDEFLARMIVKCPVPVVTGIGHEPDTSIADMVADVRASTPTAAAEAVSPAVRTLKRCSMRAAAAWMPAFSVLSKAVRRRSGALQAVRSSATPMRCWRPPRKGWTCAPIGLQGRCLPAWIATVRRPIGCASV